MPPTRPRPRRRSLWWSRSAPSPRRPPTRRPSSSRATTGPSRPPFAPSTTTRRSTPMSPIRHPGPRQPVRLRAPHHAPRLHRRPPSDRRARVMFSGAHVQAHHNPERAAKITHQAQALTGQTTKHACCTIEPVPDDEIDPGSNQNSMLEAWKSTPRTRATASPARRPGTRTCWRTPRSSSLTRT
ncbi:serine/arginine repetitive matrix protein 1-like isoform X1 [Triticum dicoccoides]|uniref:serine/arginine repetitive matrix protein 1-like isoform X1 n=1 Tax=Triticum dicoccoides TaxID=85692 RepID=UPI00189167D2|nr:serine/arginine repetitive matrix protein 1-like isoform X1 [Triticum dicoccoides]